MKLEHITLEERHSALENRYKELEIAKYSGDLRARVESAFDGLLEKDDKIRDLKT